MNFAHFHLLLNHWPIIGTFIGFALFLFSFFRNNEDLRRASLIIFAVVGLLTIPTFESGIGAQVMLRKDPGVSAAMMDRHEGAALLALWFLLATGALALIGLWQGHRDSRPARWTLVSIFIVSLLTVICTIRTGNTGGDIRHPEDRPPSERMTVTEGKFGSIMYAMEPSPTKFTNLVVYSRWCTAFFMDLHFIGLAMIIGVVGILDIRIMGFAKQIPVSALHKFVPWGLAGLGINIVTGLTVFMGSPEYYMFDDVFWYKMFSLLLLGVNVAAFYMTGIFDDVEHLGSGEDAQIPAKLVAASSLILWAAVIVFGRYIQARDATFPPIFN